MTISAEVLEEITNQGYRWVLSQQARFRGVSRLLSTEEKNTMQAYFEPETLETARIAETSELEEPSFVTKWMGEGIPRLLDFRNMAGIVFVDTIVVPGQRPHRRSRWLSLLFHELVHVAQWRLLTPDRMIRVYMEGWASNGFDYHRIPVEVQAYSLQREFESSKAPFSVEDRVRELFRL